MTGPAPRRTRHAVPVAVLAGAVAYPAALAFEPRPGWALAVAALGGVAAGAGARSAADAGAARPGPAAAALLLAGMCGDVLVRAGLLVAAGAPVDDAILGISAVGAGLVLAGAWWVGRALAARMAEAVDAGIPPGHVKPVGHLLLVAGCLVLAAAGVAQWRAPAGSVAATLVPFAVVVYAAGAGLAYERLRRAALLSGWRRSGRLVDPAVAGNWGTWVTVFLLGSLAVTSLWLLPPAEPLRRVAEEGSARAAASFGEFFDRQRLSRDGLPGGTVAGESMPAREPAPPDVDRRTITVREVADWLLQPATTFEEGVPLQPGGDRPQRWGITPQLIATAALLVTVVLAGLVWLRRRTAREDLAVWAAIVAWFAGLKAAVAAMFRRRAGGPVDGRQPGHEPGGDSREPPSRPRRWLRPSDPRAQVKHDYLRVVDRAARRGLPRNPTQSPDAYARVLRPALPDHARDVDEITGHFLEARYSDHPIGTRTAERTRSISRTLCRALRRPDRVREPPGR